MSDTTDLRAKAAAATPGPWLYAEDFPVVVLRTIGAPIVCQMCPNMDDHPGTQDVANGRFIAAADPTTVLALLDELAAAQTELEEERIALGHATNNNRALHAELAAATERERALRVGMHAKPCPPSAGTEPTTVHDPQAIRAAMEDTIA